MLVDHEKVLAKADELLPDALEQLGNLRLGIEKSSDLSQFAIADAKHTLLRVVITAAGQKCAFDSMRVKVWMDGRHPVIRIEGITP